MHELALAQELVTIIERVARENGATRVRRALLALGTLTHVEPKTLRFGFEVVRRGTLASDCILEIERVAVTARCPQCGFEGEIEDGSLGCPSCHGVGLKVVRGRELRLVHIDVDDDNDAEVRDA